MVLTVTLNPLLERRMSFSEIVLGKENRNGKEILKVGGKGINVSRQLNRLGVDTVAFTILGGENGKIIKELLFKENIKNTSVRTKLETRESFIIKDDKTRAITSYFGENKILETEEVEEFKQKLEKIIQNCEIVVFSGSSPCPAADSIFPYGIELAKKHDKISVCDTYGSALAACIEKGPTVIHNNVEEIENSLGKKLASEKEITDFLKYLYSKGVKQSFITNGAKQTYASNFDFHYQITGDELKDVCDSTGSGDAFTSGIVYGLENDLTFKETVVLAAKLGAANAKSFEACNIAQEELDGFAYNAKVLEIGKKMKILDVTPT
jgi:1-phosphofructokinase family hexose kinase